MQRTITIHNHGKYVPPVGEQRLYEAGLGYLCAWGIGYLDIYVARNGDLSASYRLTALDPPNFVMGGIRDPRDGTYSFHS